MSKSRGCQTCRAPA